MTALSIFNRNKKKSDIIDKPNPNINKSNLSMYPMNLDFDPQENDRILGYNAICNIFCENCKQESKVAICYCSVDDDRSEFDIIQYYKTLANSFTELGFPAVVKFYCKECSAKKYRRSNRNIVLSVSMPDCENPTISYPETIPFDFKTYNVILEFLKGANTVEKLSKVMGYTIEKEWLTYELKRVLGKNDLL